MMTDIMDNRFECPQLMWNLRHRETTWVYVRLARELRIYQGVATRPDTNHRHHAIIRVHRTYLDWVRSTGSGQMGDYNATRSYGLVIYTDAFEGEARRFYVYNFLGWQMPVSTAYYIDTKTAAPRLHTKLARELMEQSTALGPSNVEILSNHLSRNSAKMVSFGTLVDALMAAFPALTEDKYDFVRSYLVEYLNQLARVRPTEIGLLTVAQRQQVRDKSIADQAVLIRGYIRLAARLQELAPDSWEAALSVLGQEYRYDGNGVKWTGDLLSRNNPIWADREVIASGKTGLRVVNNRQSRQAAYEVLCEVVGVSP